MMNRFEFFKTLVGGAAGLAAAVHAKGTDKPSREATSGRRRLKTATPTPKAAAVPQEPPVIQDRNIRFQYETGSREIHFYYPKSLVAESEPAMIDITTLSHGAGSQFMAYKTTGRFKFNSLVNPSEGNFRGPETMKRCFKALHDKTEWTFVFHFRECSRDTTVRVRGLLVELMQGAEQGSLLHVEGTIVVNGEVQMG